MRPNWRVSDSQVSVFYRHFGVRQRIARPISAGLISTRLPGTALFRADWLQAEDHASPLKATLKISM